LRLPFPWASNIDNEKQIRYNVSRLYGFYPVDGYIRKPDEYQRYFGGEMKKKYIIIIVSYLVLVFSAYSVMFLKNAFNPVIAGSTSETIIFNSDLGLEHIMDKYIKAINSTNKYKIVNDSLDQNLGDAAVIYESHLKDFKSDEYIKDVVASDNVILTVSKKNSVANLTENQLEDILSGKINSWKNLNGKDERIIVMTDLAGYNYLSKKFKNISSVNLIRNADINYFVKDDEYVLQIIHASLFSNDSKEITLDNFAPDDYEKYPLQDPVILAYKNKYTDLFKNIDLLR
jgi:hypothetical protein